MVRWILEIDSDFNVPVKVEIEDSEYSGSAIQVKGGDSAIVRTAGQPNSDPNRKVFDSRLELSLAGTRGQYNDLFIRDLSRFRVKLYIDGDFDSVYIPIPDTFRVPDVQNDDFGNFAISIQCASFRSFNQRDVWGVLEVDPDDIPIKSRLQTIHAIINDLFDLPIIDGSVFSPANGLGASPLLKQWVDYTRLEGLNAYEALELLIPKGHQYRMSKGAVIIVPVTESQFSGFRYSGPSLGFPSSETFNDNFTAIRLGRVLETSKNKLQKYDGVRRIYDPLESANAVPSGSLNAEDFGIEEPSDAQTVEFPNGWERVNYPGGFDTRLVSTSVGGSRFAWEIPETAPTIQAGILPAAWTVPSKEILAGQRLLIRLTADYDSRNRFAIFPLTIRVGSKFLNKPFFQVGEPQWEDFGVLGVGVNSRSGYVDYEFLTPPIPRTGQLQLTIETPTPDGASWEWNQDHVLRISEISIDPVDEEGEVLRRSETLAGSKGDVYEYTEGFGDGFSSFTPGALRNTTGSGGFTEGGLVLTEQWQYGGETLPLDQLETKYLFSQLSRDLDRISGTADVFDFIALIEGKRVNYISTDFRYGNSEIELIEIEEHDLETATEDRREKGSGSFGGGGATIGEGFENKEFFPFAYNAIGELRETIENEERTAIDVNISIPFNKGTEYFIVNEAELSVLDRQEGIYPINPVTTDSEGNRLSPSDAGYEDGIRQYGPGLLDGDNALPIQSTLINAPEGSLIFKGSTQEAIDPDYPDFSFIDDTLEVAEDTLRSSMDLIAQGVNFAKVSADNVNLVTGNILLEGVEGDLDDIADGADFARVAAVQLSATGLVFLEIAIGDLDDIDNGTDFARVRATAVSAGEILLVEAIGDLDDLADGTNFQRVSSTQLTAGGIVLLSVASGDLDDIGDGTNFGRVNIINIDASTGRITLVEALGDIDDISDGSTYARVLATEVSAGHIKIVGPDGQTVIDQGQIFTDEIFASEVTVTDIITMLYQNTTGIPSSSSLIFRNSEAGTIRGSLTYGNAVHKLDPSVGAGTFNPEAIKLVSTNRDVSVDANDGSAQLRGNIVRLDTQGSGGRVQMYFSQNDSMMRIISSHETTGIISASEEGRIQVEIDTGDGFETRYIQLYSS